MACFGSKRRKNNTIPEPDYKSLMRLTHFNKAELKEIFDRYEDIANESEGVIEKVDFLAIPEFQCCPIASVVFDRETNIKTKITMEFVDFCMLLDVFSKATPMSVKAKYLFDLIRKPELQYITIEEYTYLMRELSAANHIPLPGFTAMIEQSWLLVSTDGKLDLNGFSANLSPMELHSIMTIDFL